MYFGNSAGVLEYDGVSWRLIQLPKKGIVRSLALGNDNRIYVGGYNDLGYLEPDSTGTLSFVSLKENLGAEPYFQSVWDIAVMEDGIYYQSREKLFLWKNNALKIWTADTRFEKIKAINKTLFVVEQGPILKKMVKGSLVEISDASDFGIEQIMEILPYSDGRMLLVTVSKGLFVFQGNSIVPLESPVSDYLKENSGRQGVRLSNGWYSFATRRGGIIIMDDKGGLVKILDKADGLPVNNVVNQYEDRQNGLWLATDNGISRVELLSPYTVFDDRLGIVGFVNRLYRHKSILHVANYKGVLRLEYDERNKNSPFKPVAGINGQAFYFTAIGDTLLTASRSGTDMIYDHSIVKRFDYPSGALLRSEIDPDRIYVGLLDGLALLEYKAGNWQDGGRIEGVKDDIRHIVEDSNGSLWLESQEDGVWKVDFPNQKVKHYRANKELPEGTLFLHRIRGEPLFSIDADTYRYDGALDSIVPDPSFKELFGLQGKISPKLEDKNGDIWMFAQLGNKERRSVVEATKRPDGNYTIKKIHDERLPDNLRTALLPEENDIVWYGGSSGIVRHDLHVAKNYRQDFRTHVRRVTVNADSLLFGGADIDSKIPTFSFNRNKYRFEFAATGFENESKNRFQSFLEGFDRDWSEWTDETKRDYTNIPEGDYLFRVRARNIYGHVGIEDTYAFTILPPWYRSWWAYLCYILLGALALWGFAQWRSSQLQRKNLILEGIVKRRTKEISEKNKLLQYQTVRLKELDTMKTRLFANISHEFRTPLTLIKGPIEKLESAGKNTISTPNIKMIRRNSNRLLNLVNQLLDLSKLDSGKLILNLAEGDVFKCIRAAASAFSSHAASRKMDYQIKIPSRMLWAEFDRDKLEKIIYNLLSNAFKFTDDEGQVIIESEFRSGRLYLKILDSGSGIAAEKLPHIFDRFFQVDDSYTREKAGSGIGLALTKELAELMGGTIFVESELDRGTLFRVIVPLEQIKSGEIHGTVEELPLNVFEDALERSEAAPSDDRNVTVLIIEDNSDMRHFIREQLEPEYSILEARNGREGLKMANKLIPDLVVTDLMMPQMDGITLCKKLKTGIATSHIPVIMLTAKAGVENKLEGLETGADDYLIKPFNAKELKVRTKNLIAQRQQLRELFSQNISLDPKDITVTSLDEEFLQNLLALLEGKYADSEFGVPQIQKELGMGKTRLHTKVKALTNHPPGELLRNFRLKRAAQLLLQKGDNISQTAYDVGFNSLSYFTRCFKELYGMSPSDYIQNHS